MPLEFQEYQPRKIVNVHRHVDGPWAWAKYTAHPYVGCRSGCEFCYARGGRYLGQQDPHTFDTIIRVKSNAVDLLRKELTRLPPDVIACGDWQHPAEARYQLSHRMLQVLCDLRFPLFVYERSPLLVRDLDLLQEINRQTWVGVVFSMSSVDPALKRAFEPHSPGVRSRLLGMEKLARAGILVGTALMPIFPVLGDDARHLEDVVRATKDHGGAFVMASPLTMEGVQAQRTLEAARRLDPSIEAQWRKLYQWPAEGKPQYAPPGEYNARLGLLVRELCARHGLQHRMPRYIAPGPLAVNKRIAERLFLKTYDLELEQASKYQVWAYRKAAWTVDELPLSIRHIHATEGEAALCRLPGIGKSLAAQISQWLMETSDPPSPPARPG